MAVFTDINGEFEKRYEGKVLNWYERNGYHDSDWYAEVWDDAKQEVRDVLYMTTRCGCSGYAEIDATEDVLRAVYRKKKKSVTKAFEMENEEKARIARKGDVVLIIRGRKVKKGSEVPVFWAGITYNPYSMKNEARLGVEVNGERVFISAENAEVIGWENRLVHGRARKEMIRKATVNSMPGWSRQYFQ